MQSKNLKFIQVVVFELIENLLKSRKKYLVIFDDSCDEISSSKQFVKITTAGRHRGLSTIYIEHNLFHQSKLGRDVELQNTHKVLFKSPRDVLQINTLIQQLGLGSQLNEWCQDATATSIPYGRILVDLTSKTVHFAQTAVQLNQNFIYQLEQKQSFHTMSMQYVSILPKNFKNSSISIVQNVFFISSANA